MRNEFQTSYGLRDLKSGKVLQLNVESNKGRDFCGEESVTLTTDGYSDVRFETETFYGLLTVMRRSEEWYNSSRERPMWGSVKMEDCAPVAFVREYGYDDLGGDPVYTAERVARLRVPTFFAGKVLPTRQPKSAKELVALFGPAGNVDDDAWPVVSLVKLDGAELECGMLIEDKRGKGIVTSIIPVPANWKMDPGWPFDGNDADYRLVLLCSDMLRSETLNLDFVEDEEPSRGFSMR